MAEDNEISKAETVTEILYHGVGGRTHVTATFPLDQLEYVVERVKAQRQCWTQAAKRLLNNSSGDSGVVRMGEQMTGTEPAPDLTEHRGLLRIGDTVGRGVEADTPISDPVVHASRVGQPCGKPLRWLDADQPKDQAAPPTAVFRAGDPCGS